jgi:hypothetical protein
MLLWVLFAEREQVIARGTLVECCDYDGCYGGCVGECCVAETRGRGEDGVGAGCEGEEKGVKSHCEVWDSGSVVCGFGFGMVTG